ncbi:hypothetical protein BDV37DRAFT_266429 [Aspergillus pseudonomiae]|uniref:BTB domain-containing protein n=1 Tax=Aspergillus pseudonomiae TaxID=1506151 RepID=A0A5N7CSM9_9EURO|nr:uncharacterized protein BDV37DRAFT_266429 [Aspergillus pseudonomiae]KAE8397155.1 hypothetical protein BDV37DRAFT_266429 [Aspergillus pseudonomiae]
MSTGEFAGGLLDLSYEDFTKIQMPLYHGPTVKIKIGAATYDVSKSLICRHSPYFAAMFKGNFKEGEDQSAVLEEVEGVVSNRSFQLLLQWLYLGRVILGKESPAEWISAMIELARLADMLSIDNMESPITEYIQSTILANPPPNNNICFRDPNTNVHHITPGNVDAASHLPKEHSVRMLLVKAAIDAYLHCDDFKFSEELRNVPDFAADILGELKIALQSVTLGKYTPCHFKDPLSGKELRFLEHAKVSR